MAAFTGFAQKVGCPPRHHVFAEFNERRQEPPQRQLFGPPPVQGQHVAAKICLHRGEAEQLVQNHFRRGVALQFHYDPHAVAVRFVLNVGDAFNLFIARGFRDFVDHRRFVHLVWDFINNDGPTVFANFFGPGFGADND